MAMLDINRSISLQTVLARYHREMLLHPSLLTRVESASKISGESTPNDDDHLSSSHRNTQSRRSLLGYRSLRSMLSPAIVGRRKAYKNRTLLAISIVSVIAIIFNLYVSPFGSNYLMKYRSLLSHPQYMDLYCPDSYPPAQTTSALKRPTDYH